MKKKLLIIIPVLVIIILLFVFFYPVIENNSYQNKLKESIYENTDIKEIIYLNKDNNYYVIKTSSKVLVLDLNYEEVYSCEISQLVDSDLELVYRRNNLYYEEKIKDNKKITYKFYDVKTNEFAYETSVGGA